MNLLILFCVAGVSTSFSMRFFYVSGSASIFDFVIPLLLFVLALRPSGLNVKPDVFLVALFLLSIVTGLSTIGSAFISEVPQASPGYFVRSVNFICLYVLVRSCSVEPRRIILAVLFGLLFSVVVSVFVWFSAPRYFAYSRIPMMHVLDSPTEINVNRNQIGLASALGFLICYHYFFFYTHFKKLIFLLLSMFLGIFSLLTFSKGTWLLLTCAIVGVTYFRYRSAYFFSVLFALSSVLFALSFSSNTLVDSISMRFQNSGHTNEVRLMYVYDSIQIGAEHPFFGVGPGNYGPISAGSDFVTTIDPHNAFLQTFAEQGLIALFIVVFIFVCGIIFSFKQIRSREANCLIFLLLILLGLDSMVSGLALSSKYLYIFLALLMSQHSQKPSKAVSFAWRTPL